MDGLVFLKRKGMGHMVRMYAWTLLFLFLFCGIARAEEITLPLPNIPQNVQLPSEILSRIPRVPSLNLSIPTPKEFFYPWNPNLMFVDSEDNPAFLPYIMNRGLRQNNSFFVTKFHSVTVPWLFDDEDMRGYPSPLYIMERGNGNVFGFHNGGALGVTNRDVLLRAGDDYFRVWERNTRSSPISLHAPSLPYSPLSLGFQGREARFQYTRKLSDNWYIGGGILGHTPISVVVANPGGALFTGYGEMSGQDIGVLYDTCSGIRVGLRLSRVAQRGTLIAGERLITSHPWYGRAHDVLNKIETTVNQIPDSIAINADSVITVAEGTFEDGLPLYTTDAFLQAQYRAQFNEFAKEFREWADENPNIQIPSEFRDEARRRLADLRGRLNGLAQPHYFNVSSNMNSATLDFEWDISRNTTMFLDYQVIKLDKVGTFQNGAAGVRHRFDKHWNLDVSFRGTSPKLELGYHNGDLDVKLTHWRNSFQVLDRVTGPSSVTQLDMQVKF